MAIILPAKKLRSLLQKENESFLVFTQKNAGEIQVLGMREYLEKGRRKGIKFVEHDEKI
jgi:hypothetical protein